MHGKKCVMITTSIGQHVLQSHINTSIKNRISGHELFEFCHRRIHVERIEVFCSMFSIEVNDNPMFSSFRG